MPTPHRRRRQRAFTTRCSSCRWTNSFSDGRAGDWHFCLTHTIHAALQNTAAWLTGKDVGLWPADFPYPAPDLRLKDDHPVGELSVIGQPTRLTQPAILTG